jgi:hypothetical protein
MPPRGAKLSRPDALVWAQGIPHIEEYAAALPVLECNCRSGGLYWFRPETVSPVFYKCDTDDEAQREGMHRQAA